MYVPYRVTLTSFFTSVTMGHKARETVALLSQETPDFIPPSLWSPNSPDSNPVNYKVWGLLQERVYRSPVKDIDDLRNRVMLEWDRLDQRVIDQATRQWLHGRVRACVAQAGGHLE